ncbi:MAG: hypothetical protein ACHQ03_10380 [Candidatus Bathyarchaeia archaeon]
MVVFLPGIPGARIEEILSGVKHPEGTLEFRYPAVKLVDPGFSEILIELSNGAVYLRLERDRDAKLHFFHSSPGTGTRVASVDMSPLKGASSILVRMRWSPIEIRLEVLDANTSSDPISAAGTESGRQYVVGKDGTISQIGDQGVKTMQVRVSEDGQTELEPSAIENFRDAVEAVKVLMIGTSSDNRYSIVSSNMAVVMLTTGFETYCKKRFLELEDEGVRANYDSLADEFFTQPERDKGLPEALKSEAQQQGGSPTRKLIEANRIDFQNWDRCKRAFNKGYGLKFGEFIPNPTLEKVQKAIRFRHRIVHVSPFLILTNRERTPSEPPVLTGTAYVTQVLTAVSQFVERLHTETLSLR